MRIPFRIRAAAVIAFGALLNTNASAQVVQGCSACTGFYSCPSDQGQSYCDWACPGTLAGCAVGVPNCPLRAFIMCLP